MDDLRAVMDAVGSRRAAFFGLSEGAAMSILFAATYPERTGALVLISGWPRTMWAPDYRWGQSEEQFHSMGEGFRSIFFGSREEAFDLIRSYTGREATDDAIRADVEYLRRACANPRTLDAFIASQREIDVRQVLPAIRVPTLVIHGTEASPSSIDGARYMADQIPGARLVELPGEPIVPAGAALARALDETEAFLRGVWASGGWDEPRPERVLATVLFTDIVDSSRRAVELGDRAWRELLVRHHELVRRQLVRFRGKEIDSAGDGFLASFDGPARAIECACAIVEGVGALGLEVRAGLHTGECELLDGKVAGIAVHTGARVASYAAPREVLVSSTVKDLVAGSGLVFQERGVHELKGVPGEWRLYAVQP